MRSAPSARAGGDVAGGIAEHQLPLGVDVARLEPLDPFAQDLQRALVVVMQGVGAAWLGRHVGAAAAQYRQQVRVRIHRARHVGAFPERIAAFLSAVVAQQDVAVH